MCVLIIEGKIQNVAIKYGVDIQVQPEGQSSVEDFSSKIVGKESTSLVD